MDIKKLITIGAILGLTGCAHNDGIKLRKHQDETYQKQYYPNENYRMSVEEAGEVIRYHITRSKDGSLGPFYDKYGELRILTEDRNSIEPTLEFRMGLKGHKLYVSIGDSPPYGNIDEIMDCIKTEVETECRALPKTLLRQEIHKELMVDVAHCLEYRHRKF